MEKEVLEKLRDVEYLKKLHIDDDLSASAIAKHVGCSVPKLVKTLKEFGIYKSKSNIIPETIKSHLTDYEWMYSQLSSGETYASIGDKFGISWGAVRKYAIKLGIGSTYNKLSKKSEEFLNNAEMLEMEYNSMPVDELLNRWSISRTTLYEYLREHGIERNKEQLTPYAKEKLNDVEWCREMYSSHSTIEIGKLIGVTDCTVSAYLKRHGIEITGNKTPDHILDKLTDKEWMTLQYSTKTTKQIARNLGVTDSMVIRYANKLGIPIPQRYKADYEVYEFISGLGLEAMYRNKSVLDRMELDVFIPSKNIAIEYNGLYWHSTETDTKAGYHLSKTRECASKGIRLIHIFENEWLQDYDLVTKKLKHILNKSDEETVYARKCKINQSTNQDIAEFYVKNHLQGHTIADRDKVFTLEHNGEVVAAMSFNRRRGYTELIRYATSKNVVGGFSKLLKHFLTTHPEIDKIVSFADKRWSEGGVYLKNGFTHEYDTRPNYYYITDKYRMTLERKEKFQKKYMKDILEFYDPNLSEFKNMEANGIHRIYDCGLMKFSLTNPYFKEREEEHD